MLTRNLDGQGWQQRLTAMSIATFPWDPKPEEAPPAQQAAVNNAAPALAPAGAVAAPYTQAQLSPNANGGGLPLPAMPMQALKPDPGMIKTEPGIKQEPGVGAPAMPAFQATAPGGVAHQRMLQAVQHKFGAGAAASISAIKSGPAMPGQPQQQPLMPQPGLMLPNGNAQAQQNYARPAQPGQMPAPGQQRVMPQPGAPNGQIPQTDGSADAFEGVVMKDGKELGRMEIDAMLHEKFAARAKQMEGGGLMLPLKQATKQRGPKAQRSSAVGVAQGDAMDDDDEDVKPIPDDELINSDLDDPESDHDDDDDDDEMGSIMLCMYDKVQRVKNKWYVDRHRTCVVPRRIELTQSIGSVL